MRGVTRLLATAGRAVAAIRVVIAVLAAGLLLAGARADATPRRPLPAFDLTTLDGRLVRSDHLLRPGKWLLVYVQANCFPCDALLDLFEEPQASALTANVVIVAGAAADQVNRMAEGVRHLPREAWYVDATGEAFARLQLAGVPVVVALRHDTIEWTLSGLLPASGELRSILTTWLTN